MPQPDTTAAAAVRSESDAVVVSVPISRLAARQALAAIRQRQTDNQVRALEWAVDAAMHPDPMVRDSAARSAASRDATCAELGRLVDALLAAIDDPADIE